MAISDLGYSTLWEAFASGEGWTGPAQTEEDWDVQDAVFPWEQGITELESGVTPEQLRGRTLGFYERVIGPASGYMSGMGTGYGGLLQTLDPSRMEEAEREFRMEIGDPYGEQGEFTWERLSRYEAGEPGGEMSEAQKLLQEAFYEEGEALGGYAGGTYGSSMEAGSLAYKESLEKDRSKLGYETLKAGIPLQSGTSGYALRSGSTIEKAEDLLSNVYKSALTAGSTKTEARTATEDVLKADLNKALDQYMSVIDSEKQAWYGNITQDLATYADLAPDEAQQEAGDFATFDEFIGDWEEGLTVEGLDADALAFRTSDICGPGELFNEENGQCAPMEELNYDNYGNICDHNDIDACGECFGNETNPNNCHEIPIPGCMNEHALNYNPNANTPDPNDPCQFEEGALPDSGIGDYYEGLWGDYYSYEEMMYEAYGIEISPQQHQEYLQGCGTHGCPPGSFCTYDGTCVDYDDLTPEQEAYMDWEQSQYGTGGGGLDYGADVGGSPAGAGETEIDWDDVTSPGTEFNVDHMMQQFDVDEDEKITDTDIEFFKASLIGTEATEDDINIRTNEHKIATWLKKWSDYGGLQGGPEWQAHMDEYEQIMTDIQQGYPSEFNAEIAWNRYDLSTNEGFNACAGDCVNAFDNGVYDITDIAGNVISGATDCVTLCEESTHRSWAQYQEGE